MNAHHFRYPRALIVLSFVLFGAVTPCRAELRDDALAAARKATSFYWKELSSHGGYLWRYSADLQLREGEGKARPTTAWVQPPGTPAMGEAYVRLYEATGDELFLNAARAAADVLRRGQMRSGGWNAGIELDPADRGGEAYRIDPPRRRQRNTSSLDDDKTQSCLRFLVQLDRACTRLREKLAGRGAPRNTQDQAIHEMTQFALEALLRAQYPNGAFPQVWDEPREPGEYPIGPARFPETWPRTYPGHQNYWYRYTLNDDLLADLIPTLFLAEDVYGDARFGQAAAKAADFLLLAQLPEPQPGWAQQYDFQMQPIWARKFEPPAVSGGETQGVLRVLMQVYRRTGNPKYLKPIPPALDWLKRSRLPDGRLARFYELQTNRPLYFTREYVLTHDDSDLPTHYGFKVPSRIEAIEREYQQLAASPRGRPQSGSPVRPSPGDASIRKIVASQDNRGAWVTDDGLRYHKYTGPVINMQVAVDNLNDLADYLAAVKVK